MASRAVNGHPVSEDEKTRNSSDDVPPNQEQLEDGVNNEIAKSHRDSVLDTDQRVPWTITRVIAIAALCVVYVGSQVLLYFVSPALTYIELTLNTNFGNWMLTANTLAVAAICPFVGYMTDMLGRRWLCMFGTLCLIVGSIVMATAKTLGAAIAAQAVGGIGAGICELTALAGVAEITPQRWRGVTLSLVTFSILPFMPVVLYVIWIEQSSTWRYCFLITGLWNFIGLVGLFFCYHPPPRHNVDGLSRADILRRIDYFGALLSIGGVTLFLVGLQYGGYEYPWTDGKVLGPLIVGGLMVTAFPFWEWYGFHDFPMMPKEIFEGQRVVALAYGIVFVAGMDFYSLLGFFPLMLLDVYRSSTLTLGIRALCYPFAILGGACIGSFLLSYTRGRVRELFVFSACIMTAFVAALAHGNPNNATFTVTMGTFGTFGNGLLVVPALTLALYACPDAYIGTTTALSLSSRFLGGSVGTAIYFNVFNTHLKKSLPLALGKVAAENHLSKATTLKLVQAMVPATFAEVAPKIPGITPAIFNQATYARQYAFAGALQLVWYTTIPFGMIAIVCSLFLPNIKKYMTSRVAVDIH